MGISFVAAFETKEERRHSMPKQIRTRNRNTHAAGVKKSCERVDGAPNMIGRQKTKAELDAEARAEALLKKAQSKFYSLE
jgi:hypothetical protein